MVDHYGLLTRNIPEVCPLFPMSTLKARLRAAMYAAFLDPVGHLQLLRVYPRAFGTQTALGTTIAWPKNIDSMLKAK